MRPNAPAAVQVPLLDLKAQYEPLRDQILSAIAAVCDSQRFIMGPEVESLEHELAAALGVQHAIGVSSGTDALLATMMALGIGAGADVVTSTYSFFATAGCVSRLGATPRFVDIDPLTYNLDPAGLRAAITPKTRAIIPVHLYGLCADMDPILKIAAEAGIPVVEDAAQAIGSTYKGRQAGSMGAAGCFSFFPSKNLGAFGDGGLVTTNDDHLAHEVRLLRNHGAEPPASAPGEPRGGSGEASPKPRSGVGGKYMHKRIGGNFRLDALQAAVLRVKLPHLARWTDMRRANAVRYSRMIDEAGLSGRVVRPVEPADRRHIFNQYVVRVPHRDRVRAALAEGGISTEVYYPVPFHLQECFVPLGYHRGDFPEAEAAANSTLALPIYGELTADQQSAVVSTLAAAVRC